MEASRPANAADVARIVALALDLRSEVAAFRGSAIWTVREARPEPLEDAYLALIETPDAHVLVGTIDDVVLGFGVAEIERLHDGRLLGTVTDLYVEPGAREIGLGEAMVEDLVAHLTQRGCVGIDALAFPGDRHTKNFFEEQGFVSRLIVAHKPLASGEGG